MAYDSFERSNSGGQPVALYEFTFGTANWLYCSDEQAIVLNGVTYQPLAISDSGISQSGNAADDNVTVTMPKGEQVPLMLNGQPPSEKIWLTVRHYHRDGDDAPIVWVGYIATRKQTDAITVELGCKLLTAGFDRNGLRLAWSRGCPHALYDVSCRANKALHAVSFQIERVQGNQVIAPELLTLPSGHLSNGFFEWARFQGALDKRGIENHVAGTFTILGTSAGLSAGTWITAYPGCNRTRTDCKKKFNNLANYGGFPQLPGKSPFQGDPIF